MDAPFLTPLSAEDLAAAGLPGFAYGYRDRVRFGEIDALDHVNNVVYLRWFEAIRVRYSVDYAINAYAGGSPQTVVRRVTADYFAPMFRDEAYTLAARTRLLKTSSLVMDYAVAVAGEIRAEGEAVMVRLTPDGTARAPFSDEARARIIEADRPDIA